MITTIILVFTLATFINLAALGIHIKEDYDKETLEKIEELLEEKALLNKD